MVSYPFKFAEMKALSGVSQMECVKEMQEMGKDRAQHSKIINEKPREQIITCWKKIGEKTDENCADSFNDLIKCHEDNPRKSLRCNKLNSVFEECYAKTSMK
mmetsp:Transcript_38031/g.43425  ORF Transcript_38031/g.43425 Transcript_38031/m.43425 type:complete len:102 (-) Transcript_38031:294-599(-)|eukprot:CAMPEP_0194140734 /NCGR_PEP_ID=MMETSP0152-20130528/10250_1 /TAXON_ID=1049557 /ORGANISM="Thalassiothrix antarctica, Strain L6-D1" /LENGTH=101 /DNA_ID=CAMNT_0038839107 /DNA_START=41 /DNA_END=346 /DNA_ORIENTATION=-